MNQVFQGWEAVAEQLRQRAASQAELALQKGEDATRLNPGQRASLYGIASRVVKNGVVIADEVGMGKTRIAVELARCVIASGGRIAILVPPGLGYQWQSELRDGEVLDVPHILRSLYTYLDAWAKNQEPWFAKKAVMVSHALTNWRLGEKADVWRWALVPELYARWREMEDGRLPRGYHGNDTLIRGWVCSDVARSIFAALPKNRKHPIRRMLDAFADVQWPGPLDAAGYSKYGALRPWLERGVGMGLGVFDLIITDEAHKSRGTESGLSRLLERVIVPSDEARRLALTATPVELDVSQWHSTLSRLGLDVTTLALVQEATGQYAEAVKRLRQAWRSSPEARAAYKKAAAQFQKTLSPYLLRRDKREDPEVLKFHQHSGLPINAYRGEIEISVNSEDLSPAWRKAICAAESLSVVTRQSGDPVAQRLRLTLGNGHGIAALLDQIKRADDDHRQEQFDGADAPIEAKEPSRSPAEIKRQERAEWWLAVIARAFEEGGDESLFDHPAITKAVETIEKETRNGEKVLVFGRFTRPLRALVDLLNAREMLRRVQDNETWPQSKVHGDRDGDAENSEWLAVRAAHRQLRSGLELETLDETLRTRYDRERQRREAFRERLVAQIERGWQGHDAGVYFRAIFDAFKRSVDVSTSGERSEQSSLALVARAMMELLESPDATPPEYARTFCQLIEAVCDSDDAEDDDNEIDADEAARLWDEIESRLREEYTRTQGGFARLMYGGTSPESRRMIQLAFNRERSFPRVLVAQSLVGREGLNLHKSCRIVVLLHPEWNPGVVEQQIGRVDRVDSRWCNELRKALESQTAAAELPRIEVRPVIFRGTYDEHNWKVLRERWDNLRAQLHGDVISPEVAMIDAEDKALFEDIAAAAPDFSPARQQD